MAFTQTERTESEHFPAQQSSIKYDQRILKKAEYKLDVSTKLGSEETKQCNTQRVSLVSLV